MPLRRLQKQIFAIHQDQGQGQNQDTVTPSIVEPVAKSLLPNDPPGTRTLEPATTSAINSMQGPANPVSKQVLGRTATIRSVPSFEGSDSSHESKHSSTGFSSSVTSKASGLSVVASSPIERTPSPGLKLKADTMNDAPVRWSTASLRPVETNSHTQDLAVLSDGEQENGQWDSTIGKAGLGKTGRVINKLVSDNDALKREIQIERLRAEEAKQAAKLVEDKMERMVNEYEGRLLEANVTKTLLARKERQVETLTASVDLEKKKTVAAQELERSWKDEMDKAKSDAKTQVDEATSYAQLMEGRYNAISSHWRSQGEEVNRAVTAIKDDISGIVEERKSDDEKIQTLRDLCEQQDSNIKELRREKEEIARLFEEYKRTQEEDLKDIKVNARKREEEQERLLEESREALDKLRWALNVKKNVKDAQ
ncbi:hypothetical protein PT974_08809 [Cladobotryum mycophilum]|uniref:SWI5-dependent HO expression protein 3 n=1 Tax=Cladobotryum mycophilum TaxID=491253 RepID=A0ABR0SFG9_9HYPO